MNFIKSIKIIYLERKLAKHIGDVKFFSRLVKTWTENHTKLAIKNKDKITIEMHELEGNIRLFTKKIESWKKEIEDITSKLKRLGVVVKVEL